LGPTASDPTASDHEARPDDLGAATGLDDPYATEAPADPFEGAVPPGYDWPTHGGYLGCLFGVMASCLLTGFLGSTLVAVIAGPTWVHAAIDIVVAAAALAGLGRLGWMLGKRYLREYPRPAEARVSALDVEAADADASFADDWRGANTPPAPTATINSPPLDADEFPGG
jgi:hypothetical protein